MKTIRWFYIRDFPLLHFEPIPPTSHFTIHDNIIHIGSDFLAGNFLIKNE